MAISMEIMMNPLERISKSKLLKYTHTSKTDTELGVGITKVRGKNL